ncbi:acyl carrier protein [Streptomyces acidicola]|uniref:acyl carrier protein n=1 Tax=Streptomyces acidicola TaxID=2596892 RepID=UPI0037F4E0D0
MSTFQLNDLYAIMIECAGVDDGVELDADAAGLTFADLGYDSLAVLEVFSQIERKTDLAIPEETVHDLSTPADVVSYVSGRVPAEA